MRTIAIVSGPTPVEVLGLLLGTVITSAFGNSLQSISILAWLQPFVLLLTYDGSVRTFRSTIVAHVFVILAQAIGFTFAFAGAISYPSTTLTSILNTFGLGTVLAIATTLGALLPAWRLRLLAAKLLPPPTARSGMIGSVRPPQYPSLSPLGWLLLVLPVWAFPIFQSAVFTLVGFQLGHFHEPGVAVADWPAVAQLASLFGLWGLNFAVNLLASAASCAFTYEPLPLLSTPCDSPGSFSGMSFLQASAATAAAGGSGGPAGASSGWSRVARPLRRHVMILEGLLWLLLVVGGGLVYSDSFYQRPVARRLEHVRSLPVSCIVTEAADVGSEGYVWLWSKTAERVSAGDRIVLWSEEAVLVRNSAEESDLLAAGRDLLLSQRHGSPSSSSSSSSTDGQDGAEEATYLGLCYQKLLLLDEEGSGGVSTSSSSGSSGGGGGAPHRVTNHFVLLGPNGSTIWNYRKAFPVPIVEAQVVAGPRHLPTAPSPYGTLGGAICFDMDRPQYVRQAAVAGVDLMLQPSWTWGAVGPRHFASDALRALENGFTTFRCSSDGVSGVVSPRGVAAHYLLTGTRGSLTFTLPLQPRVRTPYATAGWALEWVNLGVAALLLLLLVALPWSRCPAAAWMTWQHRRGNGEDSRRGQVTDDDAIDTFREDGGRLQREVLHPYPQDSVEGQRVPLLLPNA
ncbi:hypothetical protein Vretimale_6812 [Volvox reticuliferus]|uniref:Uncharacterized protein n=1 Tax=Volvox reticuliferus TaxID=1737510 RepID=A0A8J4CFC6_9CHLO|nr:hypothetical protein Vretifemale_7006 [Volvox reticuliferus]GIM02095.1 hypothetical protein Vretimale_6812 [Volvox reticuliferus]